MRWEICRFAAAAQPAGKQKDVERKMLVYGCIGFLGICAVFDARTKQIPFRFIAAFGTGAMIYRLLTGQLLELSVAAGVIFGVVMLLAAKCFPKQIGEGDGWMLMVTGLFTGFTVSLESFFIGIVLAASASLVLLVSKKGSLQTALPFAPFLFAGYLLCVCLG